MSKKKWLSDQYPNLCSGKVLVSRDILYLTNKANRDEQYMYPLANICSIDFQYAYDCLDTNERLELSVAPMDLILILETSRHDKQMFLAKNMELMFDYFGYDDYGG